MRANRIERGRRQSESCSTFDTLEPRQLLATGFNPDGPTIATPAESPSSILTADFDGDSKPDLVMAVGKDILFQKGRGGGKFNAPALIARLNLPAGLLGAGDFNLDGNLDLISVEKGVVRGWHRMLINNGAANFTLTSFGRSWTAVDTVTVGNIDFDGQDEVLLEGVSPILTLGGAASIIASEAPDQIRILDPRPVFVIVPFGNNILPPPLQFRFTDLGVAIEAFKLAQPRLVPFIEGPLHNNIVVGGEHPDDPALGFIQVFAFADPTPQPGNPQLPIIPVLPLDNAAQVAPQLFNAASARITIEDVPTSFGAADFDGEGRLDLAVSTLGYPIVPPNNPLGLGDFRASTLLLKRTGIEGTLAFAAPETIHFETLTGRASMLRALVPEYRIATVSDINSDGKLDVGLSIVEEFVGQTISRRVARFVQVLHAEVGTAFVSSIVSLITADSTFASGFVRPHIFHAADVRRVGRPDLIVADPPNLSGVTRVQILYNVRGVPLVPHPLG